MSFSNIDLSERKMECFWENYKNSMKFIEPLMKKHNLNDEKVVEVLKK